MILEETFNLKTFTYSRAAERLGIDNNEMTDEQLENGIKLHKLLVNIQEHLSIKFNKLIPIKINSGFRSAELNKAVGGVSTSQHCKFQAADTVAVGISLEDYYQTLKQLAKEKIITFGQVILEYGKNTELELDDWIHISTPTGRLINDFKRSPIRKEDGAKMDGNRDYIKDPL